MAIECESTRRFRVCFGAENVTESTVLVVAAVIEDVAVTVDDTVAAESTDE